MSDVLLTHSYFMHFDAKQEKAMAPYPPLGTLYAASSLEKNRFRVELFDTMLASSEAEIQSYLEQYRPPIVAIYDDDFNYLSKMCLSRMREAALSMARLAKRYGAFVIVHGSDSADHFEAFLNQSVDAVIVGEGEQTLTEICTRVLREDNRDLDGIAGVASKVYGRIRRAEKRPLMKHVDDLPFPAWHLVDAARYRAAWEKSHGYYSVNMVTTRGCPFHCNWCAKPIYGQVYNSRSPENVIEEMSLLQKTLHPDHIWFADDIFGLKPGWVQRFAVLVETAQVRTRYKIQSRVDLLVEGNTVEALAKSGCEEAWVGAESGSQKILDSMEKGTTIAQIYEARNLLRTHGIRTAFFLQFGYLGEDRSDIKATIRMVKDLMPDDIGISVSYPLPGTKFYTKVKQDLREKQNWVDSDDLALMFRGTYSPAYYRRLHRYVHKLYRFWKGVRLLSDLVTLKMSWHGGQMRTIVLMVYYAPAAMLDRCRLALLQNS